MQKKTDTKGEKKKSKQRLTPRGEKAGKKQTRIEYATERKTMISMENGLRTLNIASLNPDSMRGRRRIKKL